MTQYHVTLNGQGYVLDLSRYQKRPRAPFVGRVGSGTVSIQDIQGPEQLLRITDWSGGDGQVEHPSSVGTSSNRYRYGSGVDIYSVPGGVQLGPSPSTVQATSENTLGPMAVYQGSLYVGSPSGNVYRWNGTTWSTAFSISGFPIAALEVFENRLYIGLTTSAGLYRWDGTTLTLAATAGGSIASLRTHYRQAAQYLYVGASSVGVNGVGRISYFDGTSLSAAQYDPEEAVPGVSFVLNQRCYFLSYDISSQRWGLYSVDDQASGGVWRFHIRVLGGYPVAACVLNGAAYIGEAVAGRIWRFDGASLTLVRELATVGAPYSGQLVGMAAWRGALWAAVQEPAPPQGAGTPSPALSLLRFDGSAWSRPVTNLGGTDGYSLAVFGDQLYVGTAQAGAAKVHRVRADQFCALGYLQTSLIDMGLPGTSKLLRSATIVTAALASGQSVQVEYQLEDTGAWTSLGTLSTVGATAATWSFAAAMTCRRVAFRVTLAGTAGATSSPILYEVVLRYVPRPAVTREWDLAVLLEGTPELPLVTLDAAPEPLTGVQLTSALWTAAALTGPLGFVDLDGTSYQVYVTDLKEEVGKLSQRRGYQRVGLVRLVEAA